MAGDVSKLELHLLGDIALRRDGGPPLELPASRKTRALLAYLALNRKPHRREVLCELLWNDNDDPRAALRWSLTKLRNLLGDVLIADRDTVQLRVQELGIDLDIARELLRDEGTGATERLETMETALDHGYLPGIDCDAAPAFELWLASERAALRELHMALLQRLQQLAADTPTRAVHYARKRLAAEATDIPACLDLLALLLQHEGLEQAHRTFEQCRKRLRKEQLDEAELLRGWRRLTGSPPVAAGERPEPAPTSQELELPGKPSLAVLGFQDLGQDGNPVLGSGLTADLISRLSRLGGLFVIDRASSTRFATGEHSFPDIGRLLGVRYLIHGTIRNHRRRVRITVDLVDATQMRGVWSESFERARDDLFLLQDELASAVVSAVEPAIERAEYERARLKPPANMDAWENYHMALWHSFRFTPADVEAARGYLQRALRQDPQFSRAHAAMSLTHFSRAFLDTSEDIESDIREAVLAAQRSVDLDNREAMGHWSLGRALFLQQQHDLALVSLERALQANPNYAQGYYARGFVCAHSGIPAEAIPALEAAQRLSPFDPLLFAMVSSRGISLAMQGRIDEAADAALRATLEANAHFHIYAVAAACLAMAGRHEEAQQQVRSALQRYPGYSREVFFRSFPYKLPEQRRRMDAALASAGLP